MKDIQLDLNDIGAFSDPFTETKTKISSKLAKISLLRNGRELSFEIDIESGRVTSKHRRAVHPDVNSLLASDEFANLHQLVLTELRAYKKEPRPIPARIRLDGAWVELEDVGNLLTSQSGVMKLLLLDGPAGVGKTFQIKKLLASQAKAFDKNKPSAPILHVSSMGRRLSNLQDVLASSTQELATAFRAPHVPILVRRGLLVVAIDGFDELVDADGYDDSWSALKSFINSIGSGGCMLLAARDTFVEEQELLEKIGKDKQQVDLSLVNVMTPTPSAAIEWLSRAPSWKVADINSDITADILFDGSYALRPFFLRELQEAKGWREVLDAGPRSFLVNKLIHRESVLLAQQIGGVSAEVMKSKLHELLREVALEMGAREIDWIEVNHLGFMTEYAFDGILDESSVRKLAHKSGSFALLEPAGDAGKRAFAHSEIRSYFLGSAILASLVKEILPSVLRRAILSAEAMEAFAEVFGSGGKDAEKAASFLMRQFALQTGSDSLSSNAGALLLVLSGLGLIERLDYLDVIDGTFAGGSPELLINESRLGRLDARFADLSKLNLVKTVVDTLVIDSKTSFGVGNVGINNIELRTEDHLEIIRGVERVSAFIEAKVAEQLASLRGSDHLDYFYKVVRRVIRQVYLREHGGDDDGYFLIQDSKWPAIREILDRNGRLDIVRNKQAKGVKSSFVRIKRPRDFFEQGSADTEKIIKEVMALDA